MRLNRRELMSAAVGAGSLLLLPRFLRAGDAPPGSRRRALVLIHLVGGNDGLNTVVPYAHPRYPKLRPTLAQERGAVVRLSDGLGLHPALRGLEPQWKKQRLAVVSGVGYPQPDYSHFRATEIWQTAEPEKSPTWGWIGRALDAHPRNAPLRAIAIGKEQPLALSAATPGAATLEDFARFRVPAGLESVARLYGRYAALDGARGEVGRAGQEAIDAARRIAGLVPVDGPYDGPLGDSLKKVVALLRADLGLEAIHLGFGAFDTHANQARLHAELLGPLGSNLNAFQDHLERLGMADRVVTMVYSEFGRRPAENVSGGTDHGSAGPVFVLGKGVHGGLHGVPPSLDDLDDDNLRFTTDFRRIYASLLRDALGIDPVPILGSHAPLELFA